MTIKIVAFGLIAEITGSELRLDADDLNSLEKILLERFPALEHKKYTIAVNKTIVSAPFALKEGDEVALMPPYSGG